MKEGFWKGVLITLIGSIASLFIVEYYNEYKSNNQFVVGYEIRDKQIVFNESFKSLLDDEFIKNQVDIIKIVNMGSEDISELNLSVHDQISPKGSSITGYGVSDVIGDEVDPPNIKFSEGRIRIAFPIIKQNEGAYIWVANKGHSILKISNRQKGINLKDLSVDSSNEFDESEIIKMALFGFFFFILGAVVVDSFNNHILRKVGFDPKEVLKAYEEQTKNENAK